MGELEHYKVLEDWLLEKNELWALKVLKERQGIYVAMLSQPCACVPGPGARIDGFGDFTRSNRFHTPACWLGSLLLALGDEWEREIQEDAAHDLAKRQQTDPIAITEALKEWVPIGSVGLELLRTLDRKVRLDFSLDSHGKQLVRLRGFTPPKVKTRCTRCSRGNNSPELGTLCVDCRNRLLGRVEGA